VSKSSALDKIGAEVARLLSEERTKRGLSMNRLAEKAGLSQSLVSSFEKTPWNPTLDTLLRIAKALEINLGDVLKQAIQNVDKKG
jgi:transcriptional regulator with XRE-family HTH domain